MAKKDYKALRKKYKEDAAGKKPKKKKEKKAEKKAESKGSVTKKLKALVGK